MSIKNKRNSKLLVSFFALILAFTLSSNSVLFANQSYQDDVLFTEIESFIQDEVEKLASFEGSIDVIYTAFVLETLEELLYEGYSLNYIYNNYFDNDLLFWSIAPFGNIPEDGWERVDRMLDELLEKRGQFNIYFDNYSWGIELMVIEESFALDFFNIFDDIFSLARFVQKHSQLELDSPTFEISPLSNSIWFQMVSRFFNLNETVPTRILHSEIHGARLYSGWISRIAMVRMSDRILAAYQGIISR